METSNHKTPVCVVRRNRYYRDTMTHNPYRSACVFKVGWSLYAVVRFLMRDFKPDYRFVSHSPAVMSRWNQAHVAGVEFHFFSVIRLDMKSA